MGPRTGLSGTGLKRHCAHGTMLLSLRGRENGTVSPCASPAWTGHRKLAVARRNSMIVRMAVRFSGLWCAY